MTGSKYIPWLLTLLSIWVIDRQAIAVSAPPLSPLQKAVILSARELMATKEISYVYGGHRVGETAECDACNTCLAQRPQFLKSTEKAKACPICTKCSIDCSHFTQLVYEGAGINLPYLNTELMISLSSKDLFGRYHLVDLDTDLSRVLPGDMLVYRGHVVILERTRPDGRGDIVHATAGRDIRNAGEGIQRERFADLRAFRGPLLRVLRPKALQTSR